MMRKKVKTKWGITLLGEKEFLVKEGEVVTEGQILVKLKDKIVMDSHLDAKQLEEAVLALEKIKNLLVGKTIVKIFQPGIIILVICGL